MLTLTMAGLHNDASISVYESCSTKGFLRGRTEAIRPNTTAASAFVTHADNLLAQGSVEGMWAMEHAKTDNGQ